MNTRNEPTTAAPRRTRRAALLVAAALAITIGLLTAGTASADAHGRNSKHTAKANISEQGGEGVEARKGAKVVRRSHSLAITWKMHTPEPGSYDYPLPTMLPPGQPPHPPVEPGDAEVFTLWAFTFNHPELCSDPCNGDDLGDTPARGGAYQVDATIGYQRKVKMAGDVWRTTLPVVGVPLTDPMGAEVHLAMAPHGGALTGADLTRQLDGPIGNSSFWWISIFEAPNGH